MSIVRIALAAALVVSSLTTAEAQPRGDLEPLARAAGTYRQEAERRGLQDVAQAAGELERIAWRGGRRGGRQRVATAYRELRRRTFANGPRLDDPMLDVWEQLSYEAHDLFGDDAQPNPGPIPPGPIPPTPPPVAAAYRFDGSFESMAVSFQGDPATLHAQCLQFVQASRLTHVDDVRLPDGRNAHNSASYWNSDQLCSLAVLNARESYAMTPIVEGAVEDVPFRVAGDVRGILTTYLPRFLAGNRWIDDVTVGGRSYHNSAGYWTPEQAAQMILSQIGPTTPTPTPVPQPPSGGAWVSEGVVEGRAFRISAPIAQQIEPACVGFLQNQRVQVVRSITVNGRTYRQARGAAWNVQGACQLIASQAVRQ
ncbi:MAG: hypothetical protein H6721_05445 [Sandaracinus sp.]|nr:hypothetical protein [Sandaracinus sp.]